MVCFGLGIRVYLFIYLFMVYFVEAGETLEGRLGRIAVSLEGVYRLPDNDENDVYNALFNAVFSSINCLQGDCSTIKC
jgi:hypothetical protein